MLGVHIITANSGKVIYSATLAIKFGVGEKGVN